MVKTYENLRSTSIFLMALWLTSAWVFSFGFFGLQYDFWKNINAQDLNTDKPISSAQFYSTVIVMGISFLLLILIGYYWNMFLDEAKYYDSLKRDRIRWMVTKLRVAKESSIETIR